MTFSEALDFLDSLRARGICPGLRRMEEALSRLGHPERRFRAVHIAGTNGKGSTAEMIRQIVTEAGYTVGLYTSPAVLSPTDVIRIDGEPIDPTTVADYVTRLAALSLPLSEFEFLTVLAFCVFADRGVDLAVIECGLGGKEDATNVLPPPLCAVFTPISADHTAILGKTVAEIAAQKAGIIKPPCAVVSAGDQSPEALAVLMAVSAEAGVSLRTAGQGAPLPPLSMKGAHQEHNARTAREVAAVLTERGFMIPEEAICRGLSAAKLPCRQEWVNENLLLDGGHNPAAVRFLCETLQTVTRPIILLTGMLRDKDAATCAAMLSPLCARVICCTPPHQDRALPARQLAENYPAAEVIPAVWDAFDRATALARETGGVLVVAGSFYLAAEVRKRLFP